MNGLENAKPGDVFKLGDYVCVVTKNPLRYKIIWADGSAGFYNLGDPFFTNHQWTRLIPALPPVEPEPVRAPQFIGVVRSKKCGATMFVSFMGNLDINGIDDRGETYSCRKPSDWERDAATAAANGITESPEFLAAFSESEARDE